MDTLEKLFEYYRKMLIEEDIHADEYKGNSIYSVNKRLKTGSSEIIYTTIEGQGKDICVKKLLPDNPRIFKSKKLADRNTYIENGFKINKLLAPELYLGVAELLYEEKYIVTLGELGKYSGVGEKVMVMKRMPELLRLDIWLSKWGLSNFNGIQFIANELAQIQAKYEKCQIKEYGSFQDTSHKIMDDLSFFAEGLDLLPHESVREKDGYRIVNTFMKSNLETNKKQISIRYKRGYIKRCQGDLRIKNLYVRPLSPLAIGSTNIPAQLVPIDCLDFNPSYYNIDILSDAAMLAADLGIHFMCRLRNEFDHDYHPAYGYMVYFIERYLEISGQRTDANICLMKFFIIHKLIVRFIGTALFEPNPVQAVNTLDFLMLNIHRYEKL